MSNNNNDQEIAAVIAQLERLTLQQSELIQRLSQLHRGNPNLTPTPTVIPPIAAQEFVIGDRVRITNPGRFQTNTGIVHKIGSNRITVETSSGTKIIRAAKNLVHHN